MRQVKSATLLIRVFLWSLLLTTGAHAQSCLNVCVTESISGEPLPQVHLLVPELNVSPKPDSKGCARICTERPLRITVQVMCTGYRTWVRSVQMKDSMPVLVVKMEPVSIEYPEVIIYGTEVSRHEETANNITSLSVRNMRQDGSLNLSDGLSKLPGVSQLTSGAGISKPVLRGLYGNRIQTVVMGMRFDNQQWQDEHGLGLTDVGSDRVEIIKGPATLLYGSEAMGGVINILEEAPAVTGKTQGDVSLRMFSNTYGMALDAGVKSATEKWNWRISLGSDSHADYADGNNKRVLNSRFGGYYAKASAGFHRKRWISNNQYMFAINNFGFLMDSTMNHLENDARLSRSYQMPHHTVYMNLLTSQNTFLLKRSQLKVNAGAHLNERQEQEGGDQISLDMLLNTYHLQLLWTKPLSDAWDWESGTQSMAQTNLNIGSRTIVPDANILENSAFTYLKWEGKKWFTEGGLRFDLRHLATYATGVINVDTTSGPPNNVLPFSKWYPALNGSLGTSYYDGKHWNVKLQASSGYRSGNLAELSSNGLHEGSIRYEIGNVDLKTEQNLCGDLYISYDASWITFTSSVYINHFLNYIYLAPTDQEYIGFKIYRYVQKDADLYGTEITAEIHPKKWSGFTWKNSYSIVKGVTGDGEYLPFIPAGQFRTDLRLAFGKKAKHNFFVKPGCTYTLSQTHPAILETATDAYLLLHASAGWEGKWGKYPVQISLAGTNLLNESYYDHLSRYKDYNILNIGRNLILNFKIVFP